MSWRDIVAKAGKKPDYLDFDKDGDTEEPMTEALESTKKAEYGQKLKKPMKQLCDTCGAEITVPKGALRGSDNTKFCSKCKRKSKNPFTRND